MGEIGVEHEEDVWNEYAKRLIASRLSRAEGAEKPEKEEEEEGDVEIESSYGEHGQRNTKRMLDPRLPSSEEVRQHNLTHTPYRNWCPHCVRGRGKEMDHKRKKNDDEQEIPEYHMDYCFPGDEEGEKLTILVVIEKERRR